VASILPLSFRTSLLIYSFTSGKIQGSTPLIAPLETMLLITSRLHHCLHSPEDTIVSIGKWPPVSYLVSRNLYIHIPLSLAASEARWHPQRAPSVPMFPRGNFCHHRQVASLFPPCYKTSIFINAISIATGPGAIESDSTLLSIADFIKAYIAGGVPNRPVHHYTALLYVTFLTRVLSLILNTFLPSYYY